MTATRKASIVMAIALMGAVFVNLSIQSARADIFGDALNALGVEPTIGSLRVNFYVYSDSLKTGNLDMWIKFKDQTIHKTVNYAKAPKYTGVHDGEKYALAQFSFPKAPRNLLGDLYTACVKTISSGEQKCQMVTWMPSSLSSKVYMEAYPGYKPY